MYSKTRPSTRSITLVIVIIVIVRSLKYPNIQRQHAKGL